MHKVMSFWKPARAHCHAGSLLDSPCSADEGIMLRSAIQSACCKGFCKDSCKVNPLSSRADMPVCAMEAANPICDIVSSDCLGLRCGMSEDTFSDPPCSAVLCSAVLCRAVLCYPAGLLCTWYRPTSLQQLLSLKAAVPDLKLVGGNSEVGRHRDSLQNSSCRAAFCLFCCGEEARAEILRTGDTH